MSDEVTFELLPWQQEVMADPTRFKVVCAGRRCGKSRLAAVKLLVEGLQCPKGSGILYVAPTQGQARVIIWQLLMDLGRDIIQSAHVNNSEITLVNGAVIYVRGADRPDTLRGVSLSYCVLDEFADMKPSAWEEVIRASLSDKRGGALFIGTPKGRNHFYDLFNQEDPEWKSWHFTTADNPLIHPDEIAAAKRTLSSFAFKSEYMASFDNSGTDVFKEEWLKYGTAPKQYSTYISIDLAGFEAVSKKNSRLDRTAIAVVFVTDEGKWFVRKIEHGRWDVRETAVRILKNIRDFRPLMIGIEKGITLNAVLPYLSDLMRKNNIFAHIHPLTHGNQSKNDRVIFALQGMFEHGRITLNRDQVWDVFTDEYLMFPTANVHDDCFPADAPITTAQGIKPISEVTIDDLVLTRNGYRRVLKAWCKGYASVITRYGVTATPDHRVLTENRGWVSLDSLCDDDILITHTIKETSCESQSNSTAEPTTATQTQSRTTTAGTTPRTTSGNQPQELCTETSGNFTTAQYLPDTTSTTQTVTPATTRPRISSAYQAPHTKLSTEQSAAHAQKLQNSLLYLKEYDHSQAHGTQQRKDGLTPDETRSSLYAKISQSSLALFAEPCTSRKSIGQECVALNANASASTSSSVSVPVYDLTVEQDHEFFAYGVLVHNCIDSLAGIAQMAVTNYAGNDIDDEEPETVDVICGF